MKRNHFTQWLFISIIFIFLYQAVLRVQAAKIYEEKAAEISPAAQPYHIYMPLVMANASDGPIAKAIGPQGGTFPAVLVNPRTPSIVYVGSWGAGIYKSTDQGQSWTNKNVGLGNFLIQSLAINPTYPLTLYAGTYGEGVYKTSDGGANWTVSNSGLPGNFIVYDIEIDPKAPNRVYVCGRINGSLLGYVYKSTNGGGSWQLIFSGESFSSDDYFYDLAINPNDPEVLYAAAHEHGFYKSTNGGVSWQAVNNGITDLSARTITVDPDQSGILYGGVWHGAGVFKSTNSAVSWVRKSYGLPGDVEIYRLVLDPSGSYDARQIYACTYENGVYKTYDSAGNWSAAGLYGKFIYDAAIAEGSVKKIFAGTGAQGLYSSNDMGQTWQSSDEGINNTNICGIASIPDKPLTVFAAVNGTGIYKTINKGESWSKANTGLTNLNITLLTNLEGDLYALTTGSVFYSPTGDAWTEIKGPAVVGFSESAYLEAIKERGNYPEEILKELIINDLQLDSDSGLEAINSPLISISKLDGYLVGGTPGDGVWRFGSASWTHIGLAGQRVYALATDKSFNRLLSSSCKVDAVSGKDIECRVMAYEKDGTDAWTWRWLNEGISGIKTNSLLVRGDDYFAATVSGIFIRDNTGDTWVRVGLKGKNILSITADPTNSCKLYAGAANGGYSSSDCGLTWEAGPTNLNGWRVQAVWVDPQNPEVIYFGTKQAGVYKWTR